MFEGHLGDVMLDLSLAQGLCQGDILKVELEGRSLQGLSSTIQNCFLCIAVEVDFVVQRRRRQQRIVVRWVETVILLTPAVLSSKVTLSESVYMT